MDIKSLSILVKIIGFVDVNIFFYIQCEIAANKNLMKNTWGEKEFDKTYNILQSLK